MKHIFMLVLVVCSLGLSGCGSPANSVSASDPGRISALPAPQPSQPAPAPAPNPSPQPPSPSPLPSPVPAPQPVPSPQPQPSPQPSPQSGVSVQLPALSSSSPTQVTSPVHFQATAESTSAITGYVIYVDNQSVFQTSSPLLDTWVVLSAGSHSVRISAWDSAGTLFTAPSQNQDYAINVTGFTPPTPPATAIQIANIDQPATYFWTVDNNNNVGGGCNDGSIGVFSSSSDPTTDSPPASGVGQHFVLDSKCQYDDTLFYWKDTTSPSPYAAATNLLWDFWFYLPASTQTSSIQAVEFDVFQVLPMSDGVHEFMFGSQCNYTTNQWQLWLPQSGALNWVDAGISPCRFSTGAWHHATYFYQRVTPTGYPVVGSGPNLANDTNTYLKWGTVTIDGASAYLGALAYSTVPHPAWSPALGVQHQLDSAVAGVTIEEYVTQESLSVW